MTTAHDDTAATWRDLADQLTPAQIARFERYETLAVDADIAADLLTEARAEATQNLGDTLFDVPVPAGAEQVEHWEDDGTGTWTRRLSMSSRSVKRPGADSTVYVDGVQASDGTVQWSLFVVADDRKPFTAALARRFAAMLVEAADELDRLGGQPS